MKRDLGTIHRNCLLCESREISLKYIIKGFRIFRCKNCSFLFVADKLTKGELEEYAKEEIAGENEYTYTDKSNTENLNYYYNNLARIINKKKEKGRILVDIF